jgi:mono/diheme cytochrome c family protein
MGTGQRTRRWAVGLAAIAAVLVLAACGRVNLEDLTPEAIRTQEAMIPTEGPDTGDDGTPGSGGGPTEGDLVAGGVQYNTWCSNCHDTGRLEAPPLKGQTFDVDTVLASMRAGSADPHQVTYSPATELTDNQFTDILAYIASQPAP